jgi:hypothetical protein
LQRGPGDGGSQGARAAVRAARGGGVMGFYEKGDIRIHFEEVGSGFPLLVIAGGGLNSTIGILTFISPFNPLDELNGEFRCIDSDLRYA